MVDSVANTPYLTRQPHFAEDRMAGSVPVWKNAGADSSEKMAGAASRLSGDETPAVPAPSFSFGELLDIVNPLHHIPVVGAIYRDMTGDEISSVARIIGGGIYGGPIGAAASLVNSAIEEHSGHDLVSNVMNASDSVGYAIEDEPRTAGLRKTDTIRHDKEQSASIEMAAIVHKPVKKPQNGGDIFDAMPARREVTQVILAEQTTIRPERTYNA